MTRDQKSTSSEDPWSPLRRHTPARIALGRAGGSLPTREWLEFSLAHAEARDAVHASLDGAALERQLAARGIQVIHVETQAADRHTYLQRPDAGRMLAATSLEHLRKIKSSAAPEVSIVIADGLSAVAVQSHAAEMVGLLMAQLAEQHIAVGPIVIVSQGRVAVQDVIGEALGAKLSILLIGERPGLGAADSMGAYLVFDPKPGTADALRNCVSNIRPAGLVPAVAAETIVFLAVQALRRQLSGVGLKEDRPGHLLDGAGRSSQLA